MILLVEDDDSKRDRLLEFLSRDFPGLEIDIARARNSALRKLDDQSYDLVLLDMSMPSFDVDMVEEGGGMKVYGGREILSHMRRKGIGTPVVIVTQFEVFGEGHQARTLAQIRDELAVKFPTNYRDTVYFGVASDVWMVQIATILKELGIA